MKNAMKKLMSLVLVAMILVSAVPFAASAAGGSVHVAIYQKQIDGSDIKREIDFESAEDRVAIATICAAYGISKDECEGTWYITAEGEEYKKPFNDTVPMGGTLKIREAAVVPATFVCDFCGEEYLEGTDHTCPTVTCGDCGEEYTLGEDHTCPAPVIEPIKIVVKNGSSDNVIWEGTKVPANGEYATVANLLSYCFNSDWDNVYTYDHGWSSKQQANVSLSGKIAAGDTLSVMLKEKKAEVQETKPAETKPTTQVGTVNGGVDTTEKTKYDKFSNEVYLYIYTGTKIGTPSKKIMITDGIAADGKVTLSEVKSLVKYYYNAVDTDTGIIYDGIYPVQGGWVYDYVADKKYDTVEGLYEAAAKQTVVLRVMIDNAKLASTTSSNADSSNPKTGDEIYKAVTVMAISASVLAMGFYFNKKRAIQ